MLTIPKAGRGPSIIHPTRQISTLRIQTAIKAKGHEI